MLILIFENRRRLLKTDWLKIHKHCDSLNMIIPTKRKDTRESAVKYMIEKGIRNMAGTLIHIRRPIRLVPNASDAVSFYCGFPNISELKAEKIVDLFPIPYRFIEAIKKTEDERVIPKNKGYRWFDEIKGISWTIHDSVHKILFGVK